MKPSIWLSIACGTTAVLQAQTFAIQGPVQPFVFDAPAQSFRAITGLPGFASLSNSVSGPFQFGSVSPSGRTAIACAAVDAPCSLLKLDSAVATSVDLPGGPFAAESLPEGLAWSPNSGSAALYSRKLNRLRVFSNLLSTSPTLAAELELPNLSTITIDSKGRVYAATGGDEGGVFLVGGGSYSGNPIRVFSMLSPGSIAAGGATRISLYVHDRDTGQISRFSLTSDVGGDWDSRWSPESIAGDVAILATADSSGHDLLLATSVTESGGASLAVYDGSTADVRFRSTLDFQPNRLEQTGRNNLLLFSRVKDGQPVWCLSLSQADPIVYFVPAGVVPSKGESAQ